MAKRQSASEVVERQTAIEDTFTASTQPTIDAMERTAESVAAFTEGVTTQLPPIDLSSEFVDPAQTIDDMNDQQEIEPPKPELRFVPIGVRMPILVGDIPPNPGNLSRRIDVNLMGKEGLFWQKLLFSARQNHLQFPEGGHVDSSSDLVRYIIRGLMESVADSD